MAERDPELGKRGNYPAYDADYGAWIAAQSDLLREQRFAELDLANVIDEFESLGRSDFDQFVGALKVVLIHLLKWDIQTDHRSRSWADSIDVQRKHVLWELEDSPSYKARKDEAVQKAYRKARLKAHKETKLPFSTFPEKCPFSWEEIMERPVHFGDARDREA